MIRTSVSKRYRVGVSSARRIIRNNAGFLSVLGAYMRKPGAGVVDNFVVSVGERHPSFSVYSQPIRDIALHSLRVATSLLSVFFTIFSMIRVLQKL
jgi:hypothetical protein